MQLTPPQRQCQGCGTVVRSFTNIRGPIDTASVSTIEHEDKFEELDPAQVQTMSETGWQKLIDNQVFADNMTDADNDKLKKLMSAEMTARYVFLLVATKIDLRSSNHLSDLSSLMDFP